MAKAIDHVKILFDNGAEFTTECGVIGFDLNRKFQHSAFIDVPDEVENFELGDYEICFNNQMQYELCELMITRLQQIKKHLAGKLETENAQQPIHELPRVPIARVRKEIGDSLAFAAYAIKNKFNYYKSGDDYIIDKQGA